MTRNQRRYLIGQGIVGALVNLVLNAAIGWAAFRSLHVIPFSGPHSLSGDLVATAFVLPLLVCLIVTPLVRAEVRHGGIAPAEPSDNRLRRLLPRALVLRAVVLGLFAAATVAPVVLMVLQTMGVREVGLWQFVGFKAAFAAGLATVVTPLVAWRALMDTAAAPTAAAGV